MGDYQFHWIIVYQALPQMLKGAFVTLHVSLLSMFLGIIIAVVLSALVFINAGYLAETFRGGFQSIPPTQLIASRSMGMTRIQAYRYVVLPQMFRRVYHPMTNQFVWSILMSSLGILVGMGELSGETQRLQSLSFRTLEFFMVAAVLYYVVTKSVLLCSELISKKIFTGDI
jgi:polar amino acid transport system permease protein